jgi:hypothetical protein
VIKKRPNHYKPSITLPKKAITQKDLLLVEVEVKKPWQQYNFTFKDVQILPRKRKFWEDETHNKGKRTLFVLFNKELTNHLVILSETMENIFRIGNTRNYGTEKTRNDDFYVARLDEVNIGFLFNKE